LDIFPTEVAILPTLFAPPLNRSLPLLLEPDCDPESLMSDLDLDIAPTEVAILPRFLALSLNRSLPELSLDTLRELRSCLPLSEADFILDNASMSLEGDPLWSPVGCGAGA
jgi:hypothetical protein